MINIIVFGQKTAIYVHENATYNSALELYDKEKFSAAQEKFATILKNIDDKKSEVAVNAQYYQALCGLKLFNIDAENLLIEFIYAYPESPKVKLAYFHLGRYKFRKRKYDEALEWFAKIDIYDLSDEELAEYYFKKGYSHFREENLDKASKSFYEIKDADTKYTGPSRYYYAHIAYTEKKYESALQTFLALRDHPKFSKIVPYYISQIYYLQKKYDELIAYASPILDSAIPTRSAEISRLIGEAYYNTGKFSKAIPYLTRYHKEYRGTNRLEKYQMGYAYYKSDSCSLAIKYFKKAINKKDSLSQTSHYHLAECYLKLDKKKYAQNSFRIASDLDFDVQIKEDALFSFAKISYELSLHPYNDAIVAFEEFINTYPNSTKLNNAYEFLVAVYFTTKNYKAALASIENIKHKNIKLEEAYQKIAYYRGVELFNNRKYAEAILHFNKSDKYLLNKKIKADNSYWRAEANYRLANYQQAIGEYKKYIFEPEAIAANDVNKAHYNVGYSYFKLKEYSNANQWFRKYVQNANGESTKTKNDALNRIGDCFYINKEYKAAIEYYDKAAMLGLDKVDYSLYQSAVTSGVIGNYTDKVSLLQTLIKGKNKRSHLLDDAIFQLGKVQEILNETDNALANFQLLIQDHPNSPYLSEALIKQGLIHYNQKEDDKALIVFKRVVNDYPKTTEANEAIKQIKKIHIDKGELSAYEEYIASIGGADSSAQVMDADYYEVAENSYMNGDCKIATNKLSEYLEKYPNGAYKLNAHFYKADCEYRSGFENEALVHFNYVIEQPKNKFTETALLKSGEINVNLGKPEDALSNYRKLEYLADIPANIFKAQVEQMRLNFQLNKYDETIKYCELIINKDIDDANLIAESHLIYGKTTLAQDNYNLALKEFTTAAAALNKFGAEAKFNTSYIFHLRDEYDNCEAEIFSLIKKFASYSYWIGKSLILLADNYVAKEDLFQAKITLNNVIDNSKFPELVNTASEKLKAIEQEEEAQQIIPEEPEINLNLFDDSDLEELFNEEEEIIEEPLPKAEEVTPEKNTEDKLEDTLKDE